MQRIGMLEAYVELSEKHDATFVQVEENQGQSRLIKMRILAEQDVNLYVVPVTYDYSVKQVIEHFDDMDHVRFLAHVRAGFEELEFRYNGSFCLRVLGGSIWLDTVDNSAFTVEDIDDVSYARLYEREERDPRILEMERAARYNQMLLQQQREADRADYEARVAALEERFKSVTAPPAAPNPPASSQSSESASVPPASGSEADGQA
ncbi:hypothetical protein [Agrobacterium larrymoorei]|uniref:Uncharacterized protein n=1 Tax=Agrobacterium larrymoorei TaxID=160699 RepID=A0AAF0H6V0_9HYPH|nr:hypothetical protein [Agrobacterium larrymoorei]WHA39892.1 hypothetical protein CFBP5477_008490 [Agrobacterium larrymoorei]